MYTCTTTTVNHIVCHRLPSAFVRYPIHIIGSKDLKSGKHLHISATIKENNGIAKYSLWKILQPQTCIPALNTFSEELVCVSKSVTTTLHYNGEHFGAIKKL